MAARIVSQKRFAKLVAASGPLAQPPGAIPRVSNMLYTTRGSLQIADGSLLLSEHATVAGPILALSVYSDIQYGKLPFYPCLNLDPSPYITDVTNFAASPVAGSGNGSGTYYFGIVATTSSDYAGNIGHTDITNSQAIMAAVNTFSGIDFTWTDPPTGSAYDIYYFANSSSLPPVSPVYGVKIASGVSGGAYTFTGSLPALTAANTPLPYGNTTHRLWLQIGQAQSTATGDPPVYFQSALWFVDAALPFPAIIPPGSASFSYSANLSGLTPYGGQAGVPAQVPQIIQFAGQAILLLGNGIAPQQFNPSNIPNTVSVTPLGNTFTAAYPTWQASVSWLSGDQISVLNGSFNYLFTASQGGVSGAAAPTWNYVAGSTTADGSVIWTCNGPISSSVAPIGAAHAVAYAGSLWLANTWPVTTSYPAWSASTAYNTLNQIGVLDGAVTYLFTAQNNGISGVSAPAWTFTAGATTTDGTVTWLCNGALSAALSAGIDGPSCIKMSDANNPNSWNPVNVAFVAKDDGTQITGMQPFTIAALGISPTGSLCVFKEFTTYQIIGVFGSTSFEIQPAQTNLGCIAPRSIQFLPGFGVVRFSHLGFAVFDGINDRLISEDIRPYLFSGVDSQSDLLAVDPSYLYLSQSAQTIDPPMYLCAMPLTAAGGATGTGALTRLFCYDLVMKAWTILDLPWAINSLATMWVGDGYPLVVAGKSDGTLQRLQSGDANWDQGDSGQAAVAWSFRTPDLFGEGSSQRMFFEQVSIKGYGSTAMVQSIVASLWLDGQSLGSQAIDIVPQGGSNVFEARVKIFRNGYRAHLDVSGNNGGAAGTIDALDWAVTPKSALARRVIS